MTTNLPALENQFNCPLFDPDAAEIAALYRKACGDFAPADSDPKKLIEGTVTDKRKLSREISGIRNTRLCCAECGDCFQAGQMRYVVWTGLNRKADRPAAIGPASVCMPCFKSARDIWRDESVTMKFRRANTTCPGCGEPMNTAMNARHSVHWSTCSNRCYQRVYRKRRRGRDSVVDWKARRPNDKCAACKKWLDRLGKRHRRKDTIYCSPKCRQWAYRRRNQGLTGATNAR